MNKQPNNPHNLESVSILQSLGYTIDSIEELPSPYYTMVKQWCDAVSGKMKLDHVGRLIYRDN